MQALAEIQPIFPNDSTRYFVFGVVLQQSLQDCFASVNIRFVYSLVSEAIKLKLLPRLKIIYPWSNIGQMYIPAVNLILWLACSAIVLALENIDTHGSRVWSYRLRLRC